MTRFAAAVVTKLAGCSGNQVERLSRKIEGVMVQVVEAVIERPESVFEFKNSRTADRTGETFLVDKLKVSNGSPTKKVDFKGANPPMMAVVPSSKLSASDEHGNRYELKTALGAWLKQDKPRALLNGDSASDVVVFEKPIPAATMLTIDLPRDKLGLAQAIELRIPTAKIGVAEDTEAEGHENLCLRLSGGAEAAWDLSQQKSSKDFELRIQRSLKPH